MNTNAQHAKEIFVDLIGNVPPDQWENKLVEASSGDRELQNRVAALLHAHNAPGSFMEEPAVATNVTPETIEEPGTVIDRYKLMEQIGEGGMGVV
jgi:hypothetical protein